MDVLSELEKLRREAMQPRPASPAAAARPAPPASTNGRGELSRTIEMTLRRADFQRARRFLVSFQVEDDQHRVMDAFACVVAFMGILVVALIYVWRKRAVGWE